MIIPMEISEPAATDVMDVLFGILGVDESKSLFDDEPESAGSRIETVEVRSDQPWVLSIDDDDSVALALQLRLEEVGVRFMRAAAGMDGYRTAFIEAPRAITLDYELPQGNGDYVLRRLKESPATAHIPVICLTGRHEPAIERQMRGLGAADFFTKPFNWQQLWQSLNEHLGISQTGSA